MGRLRLLVFDICFLLETHSYFWGRRKVKCGGSQTIDGFFRTQSGASDQACDILFILMIDDRLILSTDSQYYVEFGISLLASQETVMNPPRVLGQSYISELGPTK